MRVTSNGVELHVEVHGQGAPVLLLHGWPDDAGLWRHQVPALTKAGFQGDRAHRRGFGRSGRPAGKDAYKLANSVADVAAILDGRRPAGGERGKRGARPRTRLGRGGGLAHRDVPA
jgi:pimeloyl-ACP methyl ester carboxylesterase